MEFIAHRINTLAELRKIPREYGVELDLRDSLDGKIYIQHNPFEPGEDFEKYLKEYHHGTMILNVKSERIEMKLIELMQKYSIKKYFFLDSSFPMIYLLSKQGEKKVALRVSEFEGMDTARNMAGRINWIWLDCFSKFPIGKIEFDELHDLGYRICFVSPELEGRDEKIEEYRSYLEMNDMQLDAICVKMYNIDRWRL